MAKKKFEDMTDLGRTIGGDGCLTLFNRKGEAMNFVFNDKEGWQLAYRTARDIFRVGFSRWFYKDGSSQYFEFEDELTVIIE